MTLKFTRTLAEMRPDLKDPNSDGPDPVYWVFTNLGDSKWINQTEIAAGTYRGEYAKTYGHYHNNNERETYLVSGGSGILILQKGFAVSEVLLIKAKVGDRIIIPPDYGHAWINTGPDRLVLLDDWDTPHSPSNYRFMTIEHGLAYYIISDNGQPKAVPNPHYQNPPKPKWLTARKLCTFPRE